MLVNKAEEYLNDVLEHKRCIPYSRFDHSVGRCSAAIQFGLTKGRYPEKSVRLMLNLLKNAKANAEAKKLNIEKLVIKNVFVNQATEGRRRTYRAHGSINAYCSSNCHVEILCEEFKERVKKEKKEEEKKTVFINPMKHVRRALAKHLKEKKYVSPRAGASSAGGTTTTSSPKRTWRSSMGTGSSATRSTASPSTSGIRRG